MVRSRDVVQARDRRGRRESGGRLESCRRGGGRGGLPGAGAAVERQPKRDVVLRLLRGESLEALSREAGVEIYRLEAWRERAMAGLELGLKDRHGEPVAEVLDAAKRHIGELSMEIELLRERARAAEQRLPLAMRRGRDDERDDLRGDGALLQHPAGVSGLGALALGALRAAGAGTPPPAGRGAGAAGAGAEAIGRAAAGGDSDRSRSVPVPRRRPSQGPRTASDPGRDPSRPHAGAARHAGARTALPAPRRQGAAKTHDGRVITQAPNVMWGTDACGYSRSTTGGAGSSRRSNTGTRSAWGGTCAKSPRVHFHFVPTSSSWLNLVERWFAEITRTRLRRGTFTSVPALERAIHEYLTHDNQQPKSFVWTKEADTILAKIDRCKEALNAPH